ncbi:unnamed protein product [Prunus armeniaca]
MNRATPLQHSSGPVQTTRFPNPKAYYSSKSRSHFDDARALTKILPRSSNQKQVKETRTDRHEFSSSKKRWRPLRRHLQGHHAPQLRLRHLCHRRRFPWRAGNLRKLKVIDLRLGQLSLNKYHSVLTYLIYRFQAVDYGVHKLWEYNNVGPRAGGSEHVYMVVRICPGSSGLQRSQYLINDMKTFQFWGKGRRKNEIINASLRCDGKGIMKIRDGGEAPIYTNPDMFTLEVHHGDYFVDDLYMGGIVQWVDRQDADEVSMLETYKDYFGALKLVKPRQLFVLYIIDNPAPRPLNVQSPVFSAQGENDEHYEDEHTAPGYDGDEENGQHEFVDAEIDEEFGEAEEKVEVESDEAEQGGEDEEEDDDFIDSEFEQSDEEDNMNFHRYVVTEEQDDGHKEPGESDTDGYNTSDLESLHEDSGDEDGKKRGLRQPKFKQYNKQHDLLDPKFHLGLEFPNMQECREAIKYYACRCARRTRFVKNDPNRVRLVCDGNKEGDKAKRPTKGEKAKRHAKGDKAKRHSKSDKSQRHGKCEEGQEGEDEYEDKLEDCPWLLYAAHVGKWPTVRVKTYHPIHTCGISQKTRFATSQWLAKRFDEDLKTNHNMSVVEFMTLVRKHYSIDVTRDQCYKAKNLTKERIQGSIEEQYLKLWDYCEELKRQNPGSTVLMKTSLRGDDPVFERLYMCFDKLRKGFIEGCRTMVGFDGAFIKG